MSTIFKFVMICFNSYFLTLRAAIINECTAFYVYIVNCCGSMPFYCKTHTQTNRWKIILFAPAFILYVYLDPRNNPQKHAQRVTRHAAVVRYNNTIRENRSQELVQEPRNFSQEAPSPATEAHGMAQISIQYIVSRTRSKSRQLASVTFPLPPSTSSVALPAD